MSGSWVSMIESLESKLKNDVKFGITNRCPLNLILFLFLSLLHMGGKRKKDGLCTEQTYSSISILDWVLPFWEVTFFYVIQQRLSLATGTFLLWSTSMFSLYFATSTLNPFGTKIEHIHEQISPLQHPCCPQKNTTALAHTYSLSTYLKFYLVIRKSL